MIKKVEYLVQFIVLGLSFVRKNLLKSFVQFSLGCTPFMNLKAFLMYSRYKPFVIYICLLQLSELPFHSLNGAF